MRQPIFQYQALFEVYLDIAVVSVPTIDGWATPPPQPIRPSIQIQEGYISEVLEPTLFIVPDFDSWHSQANEPVLPKKPLVNVGQSLPILEPTLFIIPDSGWFPLTNQPVYAKIPLVNEGQSSLVLEPTLFIVPITDWFPLTNQPLFPVEQPEFIDYNLSFTAILVVEDFFPDWVYPAQIPIQPKVLVQESVIVEPFEPTLFIIPAFDSWHRQASEPVLPKQVPVNEGGSLPILLESLFTAAVIVSGPFKIITQQTYLVGAITEQGYTAGDIKSQQYGAGPETQDGDC